MIRLLAFVTALLLPLGAQAQQLPALYQVVGVASDDMLNVRAEPTARSMILDRLMPFEYNIEVVRLSANGKWGLISAGERMGWVSMRYMEHTPNAAPGEVPRPMRCGGNEPFWGLSMYPGGSEFNSPEGGRHDLTTLGEAAAWQGYAALFEEGPTLNRTLTIERGYCDDGMSELEYGFRAVLFNQAPDGNSLFFGCCTMDNR